MFKFNPGRLALVISLLWAVAVAAETAETVNNTVKWTTASEVENFGYDVYRGDLEEGPFRRLTERPVAGAGTTDEPQHYRYVDDTIEEGKVYYYYVESIALDGARERFTPVFPSKPKFARTD